MRRHKVRYVVLSPRASFTCDTPAQARAALKQGCRILGLGPFNCHPPCKIWVNLPYKAWIGTTVSAHKVRRIDDNTWEAESTQDPYKRSTRNAK